MSPNIPAQSLVGALDAAAFTIVRTDAQGLIVAANPVTERWLGYRPDELIGIETPLLFHDSRELAEHLWARNLTFARERSGPSLAARVLHCLAGTPRRSWQFRNRLGQIHYAIVSVSPIHDAQGMLAGFLWMAAALSGTHRVVLPARLQTPAARALSVADQARYLTRHDPLTGLSNRLTFTELLTQRLADAHAHDVRLAVVAVNLHQLKNANDAHGFWFGDRLLIAVTRRLEQCFASPALLGRLGGDQFMVATALDFQTDDGRAALRRLGNTLASPYTVGGERVRLPHAVGVALFPQDGRQAETLIQRATLASRQARESGAGGSAFYAPAMARQLQRRKRLETALWDAFENNALALHYQPQWAITPAATPPKLIGWTARLHWALEGRSIPPAQWMPVAAATGLITPLTDWVYQTACLQIRAWQATLAEPQTITLTVAAQPIRDDAFIERLRAALTATQVDASQIELAFADSLLTGDPAAIDTLFRALEALGIARAIAHASTGLAGLARLRPWGIRTLTIDYALIQVMRRNPRGEALVRAMIALAHAAGTRTLVQGVATAEQHAHLQRLGCHAFQGPLPGPPMTAEQATIWLTQLTAHPESDRFPLPINDRTPA